MVVCIVMSCLFFVAFWSPAGKVLTSLLGYADFVLLMNAHITQKKINLPKLLFVN